MRAEGPKIEHHTGAFNNPQTANHNHLPTHSPISELLTLGQKTSGAPQTECDSHWHVGMNQSTKFTEKLKHDENANLEKVRISTLINTEHSGHSKRKRSSTVYFAQDSQLIEITRRYTANNILHFQPSTEEARQSQRYLHPTTRRDYSTQ